MNLPPIDTIELERLPVGMAILKAILVNPLTNYFMTRERLSRWMEKNPSEMALASIEEPGGWKSMRAAYENKPGANWLDRVIVNYGTFPKALRNRKRISVSLLAALIDACDHDHVHVVAVGAGGGNNVLEAMAMAQHPDVRACLIDINAGAFEYGRQVASQLGLSDRLQFIQGDACDIRTMVDWDPELVTLIGIIEYLSDEELLRLLRAMHDAMDTGSHVLVNSIGNRHGIDRFLRRVFRLNLNYRSPERVSEFLAEAGFEACHDQDEPMNVYHLLIGRRA